MDEAKEPAGRIDRVVVGDPIAAGGRTLLPVARAGGWHGGGGNEQGKGAGALLRVQPVEVRVTEPGGEEYVIPITDPTADAMRQMAAIGLVVAAVSILLMLVGLLRPRT